MLVTLALFSAGIAMGIGGALIWAWAVRSGQFRDLEKTKEQLFWPDIAPGPDSFPGREGDPALGRPGGDTSRREG